MSHLVITVTLALLVVTLHTNFALGSISFIFSFWQKSSQIIGFWPKLRDWRPHLEYPGSAADICFQFYTVSEKNGQNKRLVPPSNPDILDPPLIFITQFFYSVVLTIEMTSSLCVIWGRGGGGSKINSMLCHFERWIQGFPNEGPTLKPRAVPPTYHFLAKFPHNCMKMEENGPKERRGGLSPFSVPPMIFHCICMETIWDLALRQHSHHATGGSRISREGGAPTPKVGVPTYYLDPLKDAV